MLTAEARIETEHPSRFLVQLCRHAQQVHRLRHSPPEHNGGDAQPPPQVQQAEWSQTRGLIGFGWGRCTMRATPGMLTLRAEAADEEGLRRVQDLVARNIERFGRREHLSVVWRQPLSPGGGATPPGGTEPGGEGEARQGSG
jgi:hypothetical protein